MKTANDGSQESGAPTRQASRAWAKLVRPVVVLVLGGITIYVLLPSLLAVFGSWRSLSHLEWPFALLMPACEIASFVCLWALDRIALGTHAWFPVITAQLTGNAIGRIFPGGGATATAVSASMLRRAGIAANRSAAAFGTSTVLQLATTFALPVLALPAIIGGARINHSLATAAYLGAAVFGLLLLTGTLLLTTDRPLELVGRATQWLLNKTVRRKRPVSGLSQQLLATRDFVRTTLGDNWRQALLPPSATPASTTSRCSAPFAPSVRSRARRS